MHIARIGIILLLAILLAWIIPIPPKTETPLPQSLPNDSFHRGTIHIIAHHAIDHGAYVELYSAANEHAIDVSGWSVERAGSPGRGRIGEGVTRFSGETIQKTAPIHIGPEGTAYLFSGTSPLGVSFQNNMCMGFLSSAQNFVLPKKERCPDPTRANAFAPLDEQCKKIITTLPSCSPAIPEQISSPFSSSCKTFLNQHLTYEGCRKQYEHTPEYLRPEWFIYLSGDIDLSSPGTLLLLDKKGDLVDIFEIK